MVRLLVRAGFAIRAPDGSRSRAHLERGGPNRGLSENPPWPQLPPARARTLVLTQGQPLPSDQEAPRRCRLALHLAPVRSADLTLDRGSARGAEALRLVGMQALAHTAHHRWAPARRGSCHH